jgi:Fic family protein
MRDVKVGRHVPISPVAVPRFLKRFSEVYERLGKTDSILAAAPAHHRVTWIHPFLDGNGRVARLMSHATFLEGLDTGAIWSMARGLARNEVGNYKEHLAASDAPPTAGKFLAMLANRCPLDCIYSRSIDQR